MEEEDEEKNIEYVEEDNWLKLYYNPTGLGDGRSVLKHPRAAKMVHLSDTIHLDMNALLHHRQLREYRRFHRNFPPLFHIEL